MQQSATAPSPASSGFAGLLAELASPKPEPGKKFPPARDLDGLEDDVATLSYEHALRTHARYCPDKLQELTPAPLPAPAGSEPVPAQLPLSMRDAQPVESRRPAIYATPTAQTRKCASVTVRLSPVENDELRQRAAEAGITVSAYLRSCAFEVETLRSQVKQALAEMRRPAPVPAQPSLWRRFWKAAP